MRLRRTHRLRQAPCRKLARKLLVDLRVAAELLVEAQFLVFRIAQVLLSAAEGGLRLHPELAPADLERRGRLPFAHERVHVTLLILSEVLELVDLVGEADPRQRGDRRG